MSHFTRLDKANIVSKDAFIAALKELGLNEITHNSEIKDYYGAKEKVDVAARVDDRYSVGIQKVGNKYDMLCDWSMCRVPQSVQQKIGGSYGDDLKNALLRTTTKHTIIQKYRLQGFTARVTEDQAHNITVSLTR